MSVYRSVSKLVSKSVHSSLKVPPALSGSGVEASVIDDMPLGLVWAVDGTGSGGADSDTNVVLSSLADLIGSTNFSADATTSKRPKQIPVDYLCNAKKSVVFANGSQDNQQQYLVDPTTDNNLWKPLWRHELSGNTGATLVVSFIPRGNTSNCHIIGNFPDAFTGPGFVIAWTPNTRALTIGTWKNGSVLTLSTTATANRGEICTVVIVANANNTYSHRVNGSVVASGVTNFSAAEQTITVPVTIGAQATSSGATHGFGGNLLFAGLWHRPLTSGECATVESQLSNWYECPAWTQDSAPISGASVVSDIDVAVCGTSIDSGANDSTGGYIEALRTGGLGSGLTGTFVGARTNYIVGTTRTMAIGGLTIKGIPSVSGLGFDSVSATSHSGRFDQQLATMDGLSHLADGRTLVCVLPIGWMNDLLQSSATVLLNDNQGNFVRMVERFYDAIMSYDSSHDVRFVLCTNTPCTPSNTSVFDREIVAANKGLRLIANAVKTRTGRPVAIVDCYAVIDADRATRLHADDVHLTTAGHAALVTPIKNAIRYVCGLS